MSAVAEDGLSLQHAGPALKSDSEVTIPSQNLPFFRGIWQARGTFGAAAGGKIVYISADASK